MYESVEANSEKQIIGIKRQATALFRRVVCLVQ
jgi:hypothetical protein